MPDRKQGPTDKPLTEPSNAFSSKGRCRYCSKPFPKKRWWQKFCNRHCRTDYWNLQYALDSQIKDEESSNGHKD